NDTLGPFALGEDNWPGECTDIGALYVENGAYQTSSGMRLAYVELNEEECEGTIPGSVAKLIFTATSLGGGTGEVDVWVDPISCGRVLDSYDNQERVGEPGNAERVITVANYVTDMSHGLVCPTRSVNATGGTLN